MTMLSVTLIEVLKVVRKPLANPTCLLLESNTKDNTLSIEGDNINNHIVDRGGGVLCPFSVSLSFLQQPSRVLSSGKKVEVSYVLLHVSNHLLL